MWRVAARSQPDGVPIQQHTSCSPVSGSMLLMVTMSALFLLEVVAAPLLVWFALGLMCAATCLRIARLGQFQDASQASGSFALSLLTGTPRSETASLLVLPSSHSGLLQLAMLDRGWLAAGGSLLFGSPGRSNRLTDKDLAVLTTHVHEINCKHCSINSFIYSRAVPTFPSATPAGTASAATVQNVLQMGPAAAAAAAAAASSSHLQQQQQTHRSTSNSLQRLPLPHISSTGGGFGGSNGGSSSAVGGGVAAHLPGAGLPSLPAAGPTHALQYSHDDLDALSEASRVPQLARGPGSSNGGSSNAGASLQSSRSSGAGWQTARGAATAGWLASASSASSAAAAPLPAQLRSSGGGAAAAAAAAAAASLPGSQGGSSSTVPSHWPSSAAVYAAATAGALSTQQQGPLSQGGGFQQGVLKPWGSYTSMESLDDANTTVCCICLGSYKPGCLVTGLPCGHLYHKDCCMPWLLQQGRKSTCPMCKAEVFT